MCILQCSLGAFAFIRYCKVTENESKLSRITVRFELEKDADDNEVIKYDLVNLEWFLAKANEFHTRPPYMVPNFSIMEEKCKSLKEYRLIDGALF